MAAKSPLRFGIAGCGNIGMHHARQITQSKARNLRLVAMADSDGPRADAAAGEFGVKAFHDACAMIDSGEIDVLLIATPHYLHAPLAICAARRKVHVMCEKPIAVSVGPARTMLAEAKKNKIALGIMFNTRMRPGWQKMRQMIDAGAVGDIFRVQLTGSSWYRSQAYYNSGSWRGTWQGEGGGILINQAPHSLDLLLWMAGKPQRILATVGTRHHKIEVENTANALLDYGDGKTGSIYATTAEAPGIHQLMVCGDKGTLIGDDDTLRFAKLAVPIRKHLMTTKEVWGSPKFTWKDIPVAKSTDALHIEVNKAFANHILSGKPMIATGQEGLDELELSNAIYISGYRNKPVELPVDAAEMERLLDHLIATRGTGKGVDLRTQAKKELARVLKS
jgi:predicted dehydrogenase